MRRHRGFSVWATEDQARAIARRFSVLGTPIAEVEPPPDATFEPFPDTPDHQTAYGDADAFADAVVRVVPVDWLARRRGEMTYELWDFETGNATGVYPSLLAALQVVHDAVEHDGETTLDGLALLEVRVGGARRLIAQERDLLPLIGVRAALS